jgi:hypothetical protein
VALSLGIISSRLVANIWSDKYRSRNQYSFSVSIREKEWFTWRWRTLDKSIVIAVWLAFWASESEYGTHLPENLRSQSSRWRISLIICFDWPKYYAITLVVTKGNSSRKSEGDFPKTWERRPGLYWSSHEKSPVSKWARHSLIWVSV